MFLVNFFCFILVFVTSFSYVFTLKNKPIIAFIHGIDGNPNSFSVSIFWYHLNFKGDRLLINHSSTTWGYVDDFEMESYTGFYEIPRFIKERAKSSDKCCATISSKGRTLTSTCFNNSIQWMYDRRNALKGFSMRDLVIPGTHQSAASPKSSNESTYDAVLSRWMLCQTKSIKTQLLEGIRYLDLRPSSLDVNGKKEYVVTHNIFELISMDDVVMQINEFLDISKDIVIVSFKEFVKGFNSIQDHMDFIKYLEFSFSRYMHSRCPWTYTLGNFWEDDRRLILTYDHHSYFNSHYMWSPIPQYWANVQTIGEMHSYLSELYRNYNHIFIPFVAMVELTHSASSIVEDVFTRDMSLRQWAERLAKYIPRWYSEEWSSKANIVAVDYFELSGIVDIAIQLNEMRAADPSFVYQQWRPPS